MTNKQSPSSAQYQCPAAIRAARKANETMIPMRHWWDGKRVYPIYTFAESDPVVRIVEKPVIVRVEVEKLVEGPWQLTWVSTITWSVILGGLIASSLMIGWIVRDRGAHTFIRWCVGMLFLYVSAVLAQFGIGTIHH